MFADAARDFSTLTTRAARAFDEQDFERLVGSRFALVARHAAVPETIARLAELRERMRDALVGARFPLVLQHADLRSKHVQLAADGAVKGYLDWGSSELDDLPYFDLVHLIAHERKHEAGLSAAAAWRIVRERGELREHERSALDLYSERLGLDERFRSALLELYPVLVAAMAERNWDYSRPRWLARQFEL
jgi:aminoglycoside phosphotransferase (APT) family kinase protein